MTTILARADESQLAERYPHAFATMIIPLRRRRSVPVELFFEYWRDAHCQISSRLPGIHSLWTHWLDYETGGAWPRVEGIGRDLPDEDRFEGVPEPTFLSEDDVARFGAAMGPLMADEANIFEETVGYRAIGDNSWTLVDRLPDPAPNGDENVLALMVFCKQSADVGSDEFRACIRERVAPAWASADETLKLRVHLLEPYVNEAATFFDESGVSHYKAPEKQYQGCIEIVFADALGLRGFAASDAWRSTLDDQRAHIREQHSFRVTRRYCMRYNGKLTLTGLRTAAVADQIRRIGARNQLEPDVVALLGGTG